MVQRDPEYPGYISPTPQTPNEPQTTPSISQRSLLRAHPGPTSGTICPCKGVGRRADVRMHLSFLKSGLVVGSRGVSRGIHGRQWRKGQREGESEKEGVWWELVGDLWEEYCIFQLRGLSLSTLFYMLASVIPHLRTSTLTLTPITHPRSTSTPY